MNIKVLSIICLTIFCALGITLDATLDIAASSSNGFSIMTFVALYSSGLNAIRAGKSEEKINYKKGRNKDELE